jgi:tRNA(fMet)-specific endonuclease VapC
VIAFQSFLQTQSKPRLSASKSKCGGWLALISRARNQSREVEAYERLQALMRFFNEIPVLDYTEVAASQFEDLRHSKLRVGSMDLKIASIALSHDGLLLSSNLKDFQKVSNLRVEDWTK